MQKYNANNQKKAADLRYIPSALFLLPLALILAGFGLFTAFVSLYGKLPLVIAVYTFQQLADTLFLIFALVPAFLFVARGRIRETVRHLLWCLLASFIYRFLLIFLEQWVLEQYTTASTILYALISGFISGILEYELLILAMLIIPYLLFLKGQKTDIPSPFCQSPLMHANLAVAILFAFWGVIQEAVSFILFLSQHVWIANPDEIAATILLSLFAVIRGLFIYFFLFPIERFVLQREALMTGHSLPFLRRKKQSTDK